MRVWVPGEDGEAGDQTDLRGVVEKVASGEAEPFRSAEELTTLLRAATRRPLDQAPS